RRSEMDMPADIEQVLLVGVLRTLRRPQDEVSSTLEMGKVRVEAIERWLKDAPLKDVEAILDDEALKRVVIRELSPCGDIDRDVLVRAPLVTADDVMRHYRNDYSVSRDKKKAKERLDALIGSGLAKAHVCELFHFGQRFRDRLVIDDPPSIIESLTRREQPRMWSDWDDLDFPRGTMDAGEADVEAKWSYPSDKRKHDQYEPLLQHLKDRKLPEEFRTLEAAYGMYWGACREVHKKLMKEVSGQKGLALSEEETSTMALALLYNVWNGRRDPSRIAIPSAKALKDGDVRRWVAVFGGWSFPRASREDAKSAATALHEILLETLSRGGVLDDVEAAKRQLAAQRKAFMDSLGPDSDLLQAVRDGQCESCPDRFNTGSPEIPTTR
ncbi:MAG: hypothetical protein NTU41_01910, partial [Chloroflexi bacterium]|nr:hypothetical protein [Chloroflexota bacterium]